MQHSPVIAKSKCECTKQAEKLMPAQANQTIKLPIRDVARERAHFSEYVRVSLIFSGNSKQPEFRKPPFNTPISVKNPAFANQVTIIHFWGQAFQKTLERRGNQ